MFKKKKIIKNNSSSLLETLHIFLIIEISKFLNVNSLNSFKIGFGNHDYVQNFQDIIELQEDVLFQHNLEYELLGIDLLYIYLSPNNL